jgi:hypothetical protein
MDGNKAALPLIAALVSVLTERNEFEVRTRFPLESEHLAFVGREAEVSKVLMLVPMVIMGGTKQESRNACYFFNESLEGGRVKYVSYHFEDEPEIEVFQPEMRQLALDLNDPKP